MGRSGALMLIGEFRHSLDEKNRLAVPAKFRKELGKQVVITRGFDGCLFIYTEERWNKFAEGLANLPLGVRDNRNLNRFMLAGGSLVEIDAAGRILVPEYLRQFAELGEFVVIAGMHSRIEVWSIERWQMTTGEAQKHADELAEKLGDIGMR